MRSKIPEYEIKNLNKDWLDGRAMCALVNAVGTWYLPFRFGGTLWMHQTLANPALSLTICVVAGEPWLIPNHQQMMPGSARKNAQTALDNAEEHLGVPKVGNPLLRPLHNAWLTSEI